MSLSIDIKPKLLIALLLVLMLACDTGTVLPFFASTATPSAGPTQFPGPSTFGTAATYKPSPAGWIAFVNEDNLWLIHPDGSGLKQITQNSATATVSGKGGFNLRWSPDGKMLGYAVGGVLTVLDIGSLQTTVRANSTEGGFNWSANGDQIVYDGPVKADASGKPTNNGLWVVDVESGRTRPLLASSLGYAAMLDPQWSFDGSRLIFSEPEGAKPGGTHLLNIVTSKVTDLSTQPRACSWAPKAMLMACMNANPTGGQAPSLAILDQDGKENLDAVLPTGHFELALGPWSPDGTKLAIVYSADAGGSQQMTDVFSLDSADLKPLGPGRAIDWSPDGRWILLQMAAGSAAPFTVTNTTSGLSSTLSDGTTAAWQPGTEAVSGAPTPSFCMDASAGFVHNKPKGYVLQFCIGSQHYRYPSLEKGVYAVGPQSKFFVYVSNSGYVFAARMGDPALTRVGDVRNFIAVRTEGMEPKFVIRFLTGYPDLVQVVETAFNENETFTLPRRITAP